MCVNPASYFFHQIFPSLSDSNMNWNVCATHAKDVKMAFQHTDGIKQTAIQTLLTNTGLTGHTQELSDFKCGTRMGPMPQVNLWRFCPAIVFLVICKCYYCEMEVSHRAGLPGAGYSVKIAHCCLHHSLQSSKLVMEAASTQQLCSRSCVECVSLAGQLHKRLRSLTLESFSHMFSDDLFLHPVAQLSRPGHLYHSALALYCKLTGQPRLLVCKGPQGQWQDNLSTDTSWLG